MDGRYTWSLVAVLVLAVFVGVLAARSQPSTVAAPAPTVAPTPLPTAGPNTVEIEPGPNGSAVYMPSTITVAVGQRVTWFNVDSRAHSVTFDDGSFDTGAIPAGRSQKWKARRVGTFTYGDFLHPEMHGTVVVQNHP